MGSRPTHLKFSASNSSTNFWGKGLRAVIHPGVGHSRSHPVDFVEVVAFRVCVGSRTPTRGGVNSRFKN